MSWTKLTSTSDSYTKQTKVIDAWSDMRNYDLDTMIYDDDNRSYNGDIVDSWTKISKAI